MINILVSFFKYLCYGSTVIINVSLYQSGDRLLPSESDVFRRQILTAKDDPNAERFKVCHRILSRILLYLKHAIKHSYRL